MCRKATHCVKTAAAVVFCAFSAAWKRAKISFAAGVAAAAAAAATGCCAAPTAPGRARVAAAGTGARAVGGGRPAGMGGA